jgi:hypothetical protein
LDIARTSSGVSLITAVLLAGAVTSCGTSTRNMVSATTAAPSAAPTRPSIPPPPQLPKLPLLKSTSELIANIVVQRHEAKGVAITLGEWGDLSKYVCSDLAAGGTGLWTTDAARKAEPKIQQDLSVLNRNAAISSDCPGVKPSALPTGAYDSSGFRDSLSWAIRADLASQNIHYNLLLSAYIKDVSEYGTRYHVDVSGLLAVAGGTGAGGSGGGSIMTCVDGSTSQSGGKQGACSHHGGVR